MWLDGSGHPGREQPGHLLMAGSGRRRGLIAGVVVSAVAAALLSMLVVSGGDGGDVLAGRPIVMLSGLDDHGLLARDTVELLDAPAAEGEGQVLASLPDATLVRVLGDDGGSWLEVVALDGSAAGWVDEFHVRGTAHVVADEPACPTSLRGVADGPVLAKLRPSEQVELVDDHLVGEQRWIGVRAVQQDLLGLVPAASLSALPGPPPVPGVPCADVVPDPEARPHRH